MTYKHTRKQSRIRGLAAGDRRQVVKPRAQPRKKGLGLGLRRVLVPPIGLRDYFVGSAAGLVIPTVVMVVFFNWAF